MNNLIRVMALVWLALLTVPASAQIGGAELLDRIQRLEAQLRQMNGQIEQLQFQNRELDSQLKRFQGDAEFRLNDLEKRGGGPPRPAPATTPPVPAAPKTRSDAFDPSAQQAAPAAAPRQLSPSAVPQQEQTFGAQPPPAVVGSQPQIVANNPRDEFDAGMAQMRRREYANAEQTFRAFVQAHPKDRLISEVQYQIGESFYQRRQYNDAAAAFLKVSTDHGKTSRAPSSLLRLGQSLQAIGEKDAACGAYAEIARKYPNAPASVKNSVAAEQKKSGCGA